MLKNYIIIALRSISKQKVSSLIAILGLALGIASSLILYVYIDYQLSYDNFLPKDSNVYRVVSKRKDIYQEIKYDGGKSVNNYTAKLFKEKLESINEVALYSAQDFLTLLIDNELYTEDIGYVSDSFFKVIPFELISGDRDTMQSEPNYIILEKEFADKYFQGRDAIGESINIQMGTTIRLIVTGVIDIPKNSHFKRDNTRAFVSENILAELIHEGSQEDLFAIDNPRRNSVYIDIDNNQNTSELTSELNSILKELPTDDRYLSEELFLEEFKDIHLYSKDQVEDISNSKYMLILLSILAFILLTTSVINSVSILTASSIHRTKEVGVRVVMGSSKKDLIFQFLTESVILTFISLLIALVIIELFLPVFSRLVLTDLTLNFSIQVIIFILLLTTFVGVISGLYPALYLSNLKVVESLKGKNLLKLGRSKKVLVVGQFLISSIILICCLIVNNEIEQLNKLDPGFNANSLIYVFPGLDFDHEPDDKLQTLKDDLKKISGVKYVSYCSYFPYSICFSEENSYEDSNGATYQEFSVNVDADYFNTIGITPLYGEVKLGTVVIMESVRNYRDIEVGDVIWLGENSYTVGAVIKDYFLTHALAGESPKFHIVTEGPFSYQLIKFSGEANLKEMKRVWNSHYPGKLVDLHIINIEDENNLDIVITLRKVMNLTTIVTMFISALGLFGLILHAVKQKNREIGIRKVLGADVISIVKQFVGDLMKYVVIGVILGIPIGAYLISFGLKAMGFPFEIDNLYKISILSGVIIIIVGVLLTSIMVLKSATSNPSNALRYE